MSKIHHIALLTAKGNNQTIENKNIKIIGGKPSMAWSIQAALQSKYIDLVYVSTECMSIKKVAEDYGARVIDRPADLSQPLSNHGDVILHGARYIANAAPYEIGTITILLGNTVMTQSKDIDNTIETVLSDPSVDSSMTVWKAQDDHPLRAMVINNDGYLESYEKGETPDTNRQSYREVFFYDQGPWTVRMSSLLRSEKTKEGPGPWWWMGKNCKPVERLWVTGRDTHSQIDVDVAEWWLKNYVL
jgi:CMP-N-acetylneuraminic acid synthetase